MRKLSGMINDHVRISEKLVATYFNIILIGATRIFPWPGRGSFPRQAARKAAYKPIHTQFTVRLRVLMKDGFSNPFKLRESQ
jgi:hypothetical protein